MKRRLERILSLDDFERAARRHLPRPLFGYVASVAEEGETARAGREAFNEVPPVPIAGTPTVSVLNGKAQVDPPFLDDLIALHTMDMVSRYLLLPPVQSENPHAGWDVLCGGWMGLFLTTRVSSGG